MAFTWNQVRDLVETVLELPRDQRTRYLAETPLEPELRRYVDSLVLSYDRAGGFLESPPLRTLTELSLAGRQAESWIGRRLGPYQLIEEIGKGGMGEVYRAVRVDDQYQKEVAIKVVKAGFESAFALARFRAERQILANLEHPNIARLLDGGATEEGLPYFVMELVEGLPIDQYCDSRKLSVAERLQLFRRVCSAVEFAHQKLVVHRDLKPGNILITSDGTPKLLDFGIAKIVTLDTAAQPEASIAFLRMLTPEYASPEQIAGTPVSTATDVYSLGVVLYILLAGHPPYRVDTRRPGEAVQTICQTEPLRPSMKIGERAQVTGTTGATTALTPDSISSSRATRPQRLRRQLSGDLDNIVLMALRKDPGQRYGSVEQFSEDIQRHLKGLPVRARGETLLYRCQKFASRNKAAVGAGALMLLSLSAGLVMTLHQAAIARVAQAKAERRFQDVRELANSLMFEIHDGIANLPGSTPVRKVLVERALKYLDRLAQEAKGDRSLEIELAAAYDRIGDVLGQPNEANLGNPEGAIASYKKALALRESLAAEAPQDARALRELAVSYIRLSDLSWSTGESGQALDHARKEIPTVEKMKPADRADGQNRLLIAMCYNDQGYKEAMLGWDRARGMATLARGTAMLEQLLSEAPEDQSLRRRVALSYGRKGEIERLDPHNDTGALVSFRKALAGLEALMARDSYNAEIRRVAAYYQFTIGQLLGDMHQTRAALAEEDAALTSLQRLAAADPANVQVQKDLGRVYGQIGQLEVEGGNIPRGLPELRRSLEILAKMSDARNPRTLTGYTVATDHFYLGKAHVNLAASPNLAAAQKAQHCREAGFWFRQSLPQYESLRGNDPQFSRSAEAQIHEIHQLLARCPDSIP